MSSDTNSPIVYTAETEEKVLSNKKTPDFKSKYHVSQDKKNDEIEVNDFQSEYLEENKEDFHQVIDQEEVIESPNNDSAF